SPENDIATAGTTVQAADVSVTKTGPGTVVAGANISYTITVSNNGPDPADGVTLTDVLPSGTTFVSLIQTTGPTFGCTAPSAGATGTVTCAVGNLASGAGGTFTLVVKAGNVASVSNTA